MLDQSFSIENFRKILDYENRKGIYLEGKYFPAVETISKKIKGLTHEIKREKRYPSPLVSDELLASKIDELATLKETKEDLLNKELKEIRDIVLLSKFRIQISKNDSFGDKPIYRIEDNAQNYLTLKQLQYNFRKLYKVKQANRFAILSQLKGLLGDGFPKFVIRTDIQNFYESIPHDKVLKKLNEENLLTFYSKKILFQIFAEYRRLSGSDCGLPRGIGLSAYLSELFMRDVDNEIKSLPGVSYYARYVDDIVIIFTPEKNETCGFLAKIKEIIETKYKLLLNPTKTKKYDLLETPSSKLLEYLGYKIKFGNGTIKFTLSAKKIERYKFRIQKALDAYLNYSKVDEKYARQIFVRRLRFLSGNTRLLNNKKNILVGVYFSNNLLSNSEDFANLDKYYSHLIASKVSNENARKRLLNFSFAQGFTTKKFSRFDTSDLIEIFEIWRDN